MEEASPEQLQEYEKQLADIEELLEDAPGDESLLSLKSDLVELVNLTKDTLAASGGNVEQAGTSGLASSTQEAELALPPPEPAAAAAASLPTSQDFSAEIESFGAADGAATTDSAQAAVASEAPKKKTKKIKDFEVPQRLVPLETDSEAEIKRKRRAIKALKREHRSTVKEVESQKKQKSWQSFQKKKKSGNKDGSIFSTHDGEGKVGVVTSRNTTEFTERTRHKY